MNKPIFAYSLIGLTRAQLLTMINLKTGLYVTGCQPCLLGDNNTSLILVIC